MYSYKQAHVQCSLIQDIYFGSFYFDFYQILIVFNKFKIMSEVIPEADLEGGVRVVCPPNIRKAYVIQR